MACEKCCPNCDEREIENKGPRPINLVSLFVSDWDEDEVVELHLSYESPDASGYSATYNKGFFTLSPSAAKALAEQATEIGSSPDANATFHEEVHHILRLTLDEIRELAEGAAKLTKKQLVERILVMTEFDYPIGRSVSEDETDELRAEVSHKVAKALDALKELQERENG